MSAGCADSAELAHSLSRLTVDAPSSSNITTFPSFKHTSCLPYTPVCGVLLTPQDSLGGNAKTVMIAAIGPVDYNYDETVNTLRFVQFQLTSAYFSALLNLKMFNHTLSPYAESYCFVSTVSIVFTCSLDLLSRALAP